MNKFNLVAALLLALPLSTIVAGCDSEQDTQAREALEREALQRELDLALEPDTTVEPELADLPVDEPIASAAPQRNAPAPAPRPAAPARQAAPRRSAPLPTPAPEPSRPRTVTKTAPAGTTFAVRLDQDISTRSFSVGESFSATLSEPIVASDGTTLIPAGATVRGRVTEARKSGRAGEKASIQIAFTSISYGGESYSIDGTSLDAPVRLVTRDSNMQKAAKVGGGAAAGAIVGRVIGKSTKATIAGAAIGAAAGTAVAIGTADVDAVIPAGSQVSVRLDSPVRVTREG